jgi:acetyltransferase-like isoleucine patch superfamily enzyme
MKVAFIGYSGHGYVCMDTALELGVEIEGYYDAEEKNTNPFDLVYFGSENLIINETKTLFVSIGDNKIRKLVYDKLKNTNSFISLTHPNSKVSKTVTTSTNVLISSGAIINAFSILGQGSIINSGAIIEHECKIGNSVESYREYYIKHKQSISSWKHREIPYWFELEGCLV